LKKKLKKKSENRKKLKKKIDEPENFRPELGFRKSGMTNFEFETSKIFSKLWIVSTHDSGFHIFVRGLGVTPVLKNCRNTDSAKVGFHFDLVRSSSNLQDMFIYVPTPCLSSFGKLRALFSEI